jgi:hypothetical protein
MEQFVAERQSCEAVRLRSHIMGVIFKVVTGLKMGSGSSKYRRQRSIA